MTCSKHELELIQTKWGFYQYRPLPSDEALQAYYAEQYFQQGLGSYAVSYTDEEKAWFRLRSWLLHEKVRLLRNGKTGGRFLDVGCGEGWLLNEFFDQGYAVQGLDFSIEGIRKIHPHLLSSFQQGNVYEELVRILAKREVYDVVAIINVIEHVKFPDRLLADLRQVMDENSILLVFAPNDFSLLHAYLEQEKIISKKWWLRYPDHLSYFNKESMGNLLEDMGLAVQCVVGDHPIDLHLLCEHSNYVEDSSKGPGTHCYRMRWDNFLAGLDRNKLLSIYETLGSMGVGRNLAYYAMLKK